MLCAACVYVLLVYMCCVLCACYELYGASFREKTASASEDPQFRFEHDTAHHTSMGRVLFESLSGQTFKADFRYIKAHI